MQKVLILGASGFLGGKLYEIVKAEPNFNVLGTCYETKGNNDFRELDINNEGEVRRIMKEFKADVIIWSLMSKTSEKDLIEIGLNSFLKILSPQQKFIFISTNAVFNHGKGDFNEDTPISYKDSTSPLALYSNAKITGERLVKMRNNYIILRPGAIYGQDVNGKWDKRTSDLINKLNSKQQVVRAENLYNTFVKVDELANATLELIKKDYKGTIHLGPDEKLSYYNYYRNIAKKLNLDGSLIISSLISKKDAIQNGFILDTSLNTSKAREILGDIFTMYNN